MNKFFYFILLIFGIVILVTGVWFKTAAPVVSSNKLNVVTTFYPLTFLVSELTGDTVFVQSITPSGVEPHDYEPSPTDIASVYTADIFIMNGAGLEPWADALYDRLKASGVVVLRMSDVVQFRPIISDISSERQNVDPHFWLDSELYSLASQKLQTVLQEKDPEQSAFYMGRGEAFREKLSQTDVAYRTVLDTCTKDAIVVSHDAFSYLASRYGFGIEPITGLSPHEEPSLRRMKDLVAYVRGNDISYVFYESLVSPRVSQALAHEAGVQTLVLNPIEGISADEITRGIDYFSLMEQNLTNLSIALECRY